MKSFSKIVCFVILAVFATFYACQKQNSSVLDSTEAINTTNVVTIEEAKAVYAQYLDNHKGGSSTLQVRSSDELNPYDLVPKWGEAGSYNFLDTVGNLLSVPTESVVGGGYRKAMFIRVENEVKMLIATLIGTPDYLIRKNNVCTLNDFSGILYFETTNELATGGYKYENGKIIAVLLPRKKSGSNILDPDKIFGDGSILLDEFVVKADRPLPFYFGGFSPSFYSVYPSYFSNLFNGYNFSGGAALPISDILNGIAATVIDKDKKICDDTFEFVLNPDGTKLTAGVATLTAQWKYTTDKIDASGEKIVFRKNATVGSMWIELPATTLSPTTLVQDAWTLAYDGVQAKLDVNSTLNVKDEFFLQYNTKLDSLVSVRVTAANSYSESSMVFTERPAYYVEKYKTKFKFSTTCKK